MEESSVVVLKIAEKVLSHRRGIPIIMSLVRNGSRCVDLGVDASEIGQNSCMFVLWCITLRPGRENENIFCEKATLSTIVLSL
jgi:hypothetical protein